ncbi:hypothetical protein [Mariprofundus ferrooxydans]|uniref:hypothetical protein n=1 Tax=Mariprofundus ferrooxydans TaxID=314344 RepID=UPI000364B178|nr:hypothetical protein [Mariprofundus ferrooxydans]
MSKKYQISMKLNATQYAHIQDVCEAQQTSASEYIRQLIDNDRKENLNELKSLAEIERCKVAIRSLTASINELIQELVDEEDEAQS